MLRTFSFVNLVAVLLSLSTSLWAEEFSLEPINEPEMNYGPQLVKIFTERVESDAALKSQFDQFSAEAQERSGGKYMGPRASSFTLHQSESVDFSSDGGIRDYSQMVVIHFSFEEGFRQGMEGTTGVFALFAITGQVEHGPFEDGDHEVTDHTVTAEFIGFRKSLEADRKQD